MAGCSCDPLLPGLLADVPLASCSVRAKAGAGLRIHGSGTFTVSNVTDAAACCQACGRAIEKGGVCSTWCYGWGNGSGCHISTGPAISTAQARLA